MSFLILKTLHAHKVKQPFRPLSQHENWFAIFSLEAWYRKYLFINLWNWHSILIYMYKRGHLNRNINIPFNYCHLKVLMMYQKYSCLSCSWHYCKPKGAYVAKDRTFPSELIGVGQYMYLRLNTKWHFCIAHMYCVFCLPTIPPFSIVPVQPVLI